ncbi:MAG TPA: BatD family protein [Terriglobales bacterium]|nr:BatD family protein [Terriglobales bacterium]
MRTLVSLALLLLVAAPVRAAEVQFTASVDQTTVGLGETFQLNLTVQGEGMLSAPRPGLPALPDFNVLGSSSSQSTSISFVNGQVKKQSSITFVYGLSAKKLGRLVIPPCKLTYEGKEYATQPIEITVVKAPQGQAQPVPQPPGMRAPAGNVPIEGNVVLAATPSRRTVYAGEPVIVEIALGTRLRIADGGWAEVPAFDGFWAEKVFDATRLDFQRRTIEGKSYDVAPLKTVALFPLAPGEVTIKPLAFNVAVVVPSRDPFGFFGGTQTVRVESKPVTIRVLPLPEKDKPKEFNGGVGRFTLAAALDRSSTTNSEPVNLTLRVSGSGNLRMIEKPALPAVPGLRILDPEIKDDIRAGADGVHGTKTFRYPVIPQADGRYAIPVIRMAYFDPTSKSYRLLQAGPFECTASGSVASAPLAEASGLKVLGSDIEYIKADARGLEITPLDPPAWPNLLYLVSLAFLGGAVWYRGHAQRLLSDRGYARKVRSSGLARTRLRQAESFLGRKDERGFHAALSAAVVGYVGDRFNIDTQAMTKDRLRAELEGLRVAPETVNELLAILARCEVAQFSPDRAGADDAHQLLRKTRDALGRL